MRALQLRKAFKFAIICLMKKYFLTFLASWLLLTGSAALAQSERHTQQTDMQVLERLMTFSDGLRAAEIVVQLEPEGRGMLTRQIIAPEDTLAYVFKETTGFVLKDQRAHPGLEVWVLDARGQVLKHFPDLYSALPPQPLGTLQQLSLSLRPDTLGLAPGQMYGIQARLFDKQGVGVLQFKHYFQLLTDVQHAQTLQRDQVQLNPVVQMTRQQLDLKAAELFDVHSREPMLHPHLRPDQEVALVLRGVQGLKPREGKVFPGLEITVLDSESGIVMHADDVFAAETDGLDATKVAEAVSANLRFAAEKYPPGNYLWALRLFDKQSEAQLGLKLWVTLKP